MPRGFKTLGPDCNCEDNACLVFDDYFNRPFETINTFDSTGAWVNLRALDWEIFEEELTVAYLSDPGHDPEIAIVEAAPRQFAFDVVVKLPIDGKCRIVYTATKGAESKELSVELEAATEPLLCGTMRLLVDESPQNEVPVFGLVEDQYLAVRLCYSAEQQVLTARVTPSGEASGHVHADGIQTPTNDLDVSAISIRVMGSQVGLYQFDRVRLIQTRTLEDGDYGFADDCPSCNNRDFCSTVLDNFDDAELECRWVEEAGEWDEGSGYVETLDNDAVLTWIGSSPGIDPEGEIDPTVVVTTVLESTGFENSIVVFVDKGEGGSHYAKVKIRSETADDGTLGIYSTEDGAALASLQIDGLDRNTNVTLKVCFDGEQITAQIDDDPDQAVSVIVTAFGGTQVALGTLGTVVGAVRFKSFAISNAMYHVECDDCIEPDAPGASCGMGEDGEFAQAIRVQVRGLRSYLNPDIDWNGASPPLEWPCDACNWFGNKWFVLKEFLLGSGEPHLCGGDIWSDPCGDLDEPIIGNDLVDCICYWRAEGNIVFNPEGISPGSPLCKFHGGPQGPDDWVAFWRIWLYVIKRGRDVYLQGWVDAPSLMSGQSIYFQKLWLTLDDENDPVPLNPPAFQSLKVPLVCVPTAFPPLLIPKGRCVWISEPDAVDEVNCYLLLGTVE